MVFPLYVPFYSTVPRVALMKIVGVPVTGKTINYILGLQMASSDVENIVVVGCAIVSNQLLSFFSRFSKKCWMIRSHLDSTGSPLAPRRLLAQNNKLVFIVSIQQSQEL